MKNRYDAFVTGSDITNNNGSPTAAINSNRVVQGMSSALIKSLSTAAVINQWHPTHRSSKLLAADGAAMSYSATHNPLLTFMAFTARAAAYAVKHV